MNLTSPFVRACVFFYPISSNLFFLWRMFWYFLLIRNEKRENLDKKIQGIGETGVGPSP